MTNERHEKALEAAEWIEHDGRGMPVNGETLVAVKFRDGVKDLAPCRADYWHDEDPVCSNWRHDGQCRAEIVAYRVVSPNHFTNGE